MDRIIEKHVRLIGLILIVAALIGGGVFYYIAVSTTEPQETYSIKEKTSNSESSQPTGNTEQIQQEEQR